MSQATCETCKWHNQKRTDADETGLCQRYPPSPVVVRSGHIIDQRPITRIDDYCGEHTPKEQDE